MKMKLLLFALFISMPLLYGQEKYLNTYLDAVKLAGFYTAEKEKKLDLSHDLMDEYNTIIKKYIPFPSNNNPFIKYEDQRRFVNGMAGQGGKINEQIKKSDLSMDKLQISNALGTNWQSAAINGLSNFMAKRFKAEVLHIGLEQSFKNLQVKDAEVVKILFPKTFSYLNQVYSSKKPNNYYVSELLFLRQIILQDFEKMPQTVVQSDLVLTNILDVQKVDFFKMGFRISNYTKQGYPLTNIIEKLSEDTYESSETKKLAELIRIFSDALRNPENNDINWINPLVDLDYNTRDTQEKTKLRFFYGLLYEQIRHSPIIYHLPYSDDVKIANYLRETLFFVNKLNIAYSYAQEKNFNFDTAKDYIVYTSIVTSAIKTVMTNELISKAYNIDEKQTDMISKYMNIFPSFLEEDYQKAFSILISEIGQYLTEDGKLNYLKNVSFLPQLLSVEDESDLEKLLTSYSLPIGSSSIKRSSSWNLSLNGYVGLSGGRETALRDSGNSTEWNIGLAAPIGMALTYNRVTAFASIIDLGTMVNARLGDDTSNYSGLKFEHFLSPGLGLYYNIPKFPLTLGMHYSYIPNLRTIKLEEGLAKVFEEKNVSVSRINFSVLIDIPLLTIFNLEK